MTAEGEAVSAIATTAGKAIDALSGLGKYAAEVLGDVLHDLVQLAIGQRLKARLIRNAEDVGRSGSIPLLTGIDPERISEPSPSVMIPLITASAPEEREALQDLWARLLANAAIDGGTKVRREFFKTVQAMEPFDVAVFNMAAKNGRPLVSFNVQENEQTRAFYRTLPGYSDLSFDLSVDALMRLRCLQENAARSVSRYGAALYSALTVD